MKIAMIKIQQNRRDFEYDIFSLVKAFYPDKEAATFVEEDNNKSPDEIEAVITVNYENNSVRIEADDSNGKHLMQSADINLDSRVEAKNIIKHLLYDILSLFTGRVLAWGTLTGIRPTKIPVSLIERGKTDVEVRQYMKETYQATQEKIDLSIDIAKRELKILKDIDYKNGYSIYIGIPFCPTTCLYCSFTSYPIAKWEKRVDEYLDALCKEIDYAASAFKNRTLNTIYIGGGTPTTLSAKQLDRLLTKLETSFDYLGLCELTVEAGRPDSVSQDKFQVLKAHRVTRISINPQTMNQKTLDIIGRRHTVEQIHTAFHMAREAGFDNINMDLIVGLPDEDMQAVKYTMEEIVKLNPDSVTVHSLAIKRAARLNMFKELYNEYAIINNNEIIEMTKEYAKKIDATPYYLYRQQNMAGNLENVGYAKEGKEGIYNILIMEEKQTIVAMGAGASTKIVFPDGFRIERIENVKDVDNYIERIDEMIQRKSSFIESNLL
ncbi:oxygen-independent coproporphyrinogen-3 oxidase [Lachnotalea glycerini]|uniref:Oxygen-independent coproporphyrinogen-3 oxidase n=1 Tax=Lachnotalea glycerini TaxID=1763509 RepID=A0A318EXM6_9FIRM|nr:coproporphyrinogen dehydrogenase HemZ [Lachnotalea glycerini]PXV96007.1 oxygen-independent coproporphyrinogen-3 oxidase [Lachnotalea glycerini]